LISYNFEALKIWGPILSHGLQAPVHGLGGKPSFFVYISGQIFV